MPLFKITGKDRSGHDQTVEIVADDRIAALRQAKAEGLLVLNVEELNSSQDAPKVIIANSSQKITWIALMSLIALFVVGYFFREFFISIFILVFAVMYIATEKQEQKKMALMNPEARRKYSEEAKQRGQERRKEAALTSLYGEINPAMDCPHCHTKGRLRTKRVTQKKGISGGKATAAILTSGLSLLAVGLSRKEKETQAHCDNCNNTWVF